MLKIGITGGIGSGKSTVCKVFEQLGIPVFYADSAAKEVMVNDNQLVESIVNIFGIDAYLADGNLNRSHLANIVFNDESQLAKLNALVHPAVFRAFSKWLSVQNSHYVLKEAALLFESGSYKQCDKTILVSSPLDLRISRVMLRDGSSREQVQARIDKQFSDVEKMKLADYFIVNDDQHPIISQVLSLHQQFLTLSKGI